MSRWAVILAGGSGTRFWPLSTPERPKQLLPLAGDEPLIQAAVRRLDGLFPPDRILILTAARLQGATRDALPDIPEGNILAEPRAASTAPALTWATRIAADRDDHATVLSLHADWFVGDDDAFQTTATTALDVAEEHDVLVTVGIVPTRADIGYGYIEPGDRIDDRARRVQRFTEKPTESRAIELVAAGALWNSGLFAWTASRFFQETLEHAPEISGELGTLDAGDVDGFFERVTPIAVDVSHFERSKRVAVVPGGFPWDDVGTWAALARVRDSDDSDNVLVGRAVQRDASGNVAWADTGAIVLDGVENLVVVRTGNITLVTTTARAAQLKDLVESLPPDLRHG